jgi:predicted secreted acid phosphatase
MIKYNKNLRKEIEKKMEEKKILNKKVVTRAIVCVLLAVIFISAGIGIGYKLQSQPQQPQQPQPSVSSGYASNPDYEYMVGAAAWQMSAEAHALMMQGFNLAQSNVDDMVAMADSNQNGYRWVEENGQRKLFFGEKHVAVVCDIDDTLVDGVHYTANIIGSNGEWTNKAFTDFLQSKGCTALPGAVKFANYCVKNGIALFYVTNRYDQGYKLSEKGYAGQQGYKKDDGTVIGSSTFDIFGKTMYDITMESMASLGFPVNDPKAENYSENAILIVNDTKLNGSSKEWVRQGITNGGDIQTGERTQESKAYPETVNISAHHIALLLGDDLNDISQIFSESENAIDRVALTIENIDKWGTQWIVFPNSVYGSSANYATQYGFQKLFDYFDYTSKDNKAWELYD